MSPVLKAPLPPCGSGLARDGGLKICREPEGLIADKPAPTGNRETGVGDG
ncbi:Uncharacterised protein [Pseudomonas fluorescens]|uniref:Uncharacterized protein n=1 Tax=Pseudomonas fluorescens TaxID=294 RepID=A0A379I562_PSEFL|nr:Uncharacterised protein [Pseudomonas fluorescens]